MTDIVRNYPDNKLMYLVVDHNQDAFAELVNRYLTPVFRFVYSMSHNTDLAEDIAQETFMMLWENAHKWQSTGGLKSWLFRVARNKMIDTLRSSKSHSNIDDVHICDTQSGPYSVALNHEVTALINNQVKVLPDRQREAIMLVHFLECSNIEAADVMEISVDALESLLARGRKKLRVLLDEEKETLLSGVQNG